MPLCGLRGSEGSHTEMSGLFSMPEERTCGMASRGAARITSKGPERSSRRSEQESQSGDARAGVAEGDTGEGLGVHAMPRRSCWQRTMHQRPPAPKEENEASMASQSQTS